MHEDLLEDIIVQLLHISYWILACRKMSKIQTRKSKERQVLVIQDTA